jgi:hypothetical protein
MEEQKIAGELQHKVRMNETNTVQEYSDEHVKQSIVHSREDIVLLVSYGESIIEKLKNITGVLKNIRTILLITSILFGIYFWFNL